MSTEKSQNSKLPSSGAPSPAMASCRKKKNEEATFVEDLKDHIDEFVHASMDEHKTCFQKTVKKVWFLCIIISSNRKGMLYFLFLLCYDFLANVWYAALNILRCLGCRKLWRGGVWRLRKWKVLYLFEQLWANKGSEFLLVWTVFSGKVICTMFLTFKCSVLHENLMVESIQNLYVLSSDPYVPIRTWCCFICKSSLTSWG